MHRSVQNRRWCDDESPDDHLIQVSTAIVHPGVWLNERVRYHTTTMRGSVYRREGGDDESPDNHLVQVSTVIVHLLRMNGGLKAPRAPWDITRLP